MLGWKTDEKLGFVVDGAEDTCPSPPCVGCGSSESLPGRNPTCLGPETQHVLQVPLTGHMGTLRQGKTGPSPVSIK